MHTFEPSRFGLPADPVARCHLVGDHQTRRLGSAVADVLQGGGFLGLVGELGAGKTTLVQGLLHALGGDASSPTYTLLNEYPVLPRVYHFDLYRLSDADDLETTAYWDYVDDRDAIVVVEWIDRIPQAWFGSGAILELAHRHEGRSAAVWSTGDPQRWLEAFALHDLA